MADVNVNDSVAVEDTAASYEIGAGNGVFTSDVLYKDLKPNDDQTPFFVNANVGGSAGVHTIKAAPGASSYIVLTKITILCSDKNTIRIGYDDICGWLGTVKLGPYVFNSEVTAAGYKVGAQYSIQFERPLKLPANKALMADVSAVCYALITAEGYVY